MAFGAHIFSYIEEFLISLARVVYLKQGIYGNSLTSILALTTTEHGRQTFIVNIDTISTIPAPTSCVIMKTVRCALYIRNQYKSKGYVSTQSPHNINKPFEKRRDKSNIDFEL